MTNKIEMMNQGTVMYRAETDKGVYTITRAIAGGGFTPRFNGTALRPAGRLKDARAEVRRHNDWNPVEWTDCAQERANG